MIYRFSAVLIEIPEGHFAETEELTSNFMWKYKGHRIAKTILKNQVGGLILPDFNIYYKTTFIKIVIILAYK